MRRSFWILLPLFAPLLLPAEAWEASVSQNLPITITAAPPAVPAFYVATNGIDSNAGTLAAPFATLTKCQTAMRNSSTIKTCYIRAGTYSPARTNGDGYLCGHHYSNGTLAGAAVTLTSSDAAETWSYYPPDGVGSAIIDGGSTVGESSDQEHGSVIGGPANGLGCIFSASGVNNITVTGLTLQRAVWAGFFGNNTNSVTLNYNTVRNITGTVYNAAALAITCGTNVTMDHNHVHDVQYMGIGQWATTDSGCQISGASYTNNVVINSCLWPPASPDNGQTGDDCGAIYARDINANGASISTPITITNNYVRDVNAPSNSTDTASYGIYLDDGASNATVTGNVILGKMVSCFTLHGGKNNLFEDNICDTGNARTQYIMRQSASTACGSGATCGNMSNNNFHSNIITLGSSGSGGGYHADSANTPMNISTNFYHNYVGTSVNTSTNNPAGGSETNAIFGDPQITCWSPTIVGSSPVFNSPVSFAGITGGWGLPDFTIPQTGTAPSWPHSC